MVFHDLYMVQTSSNQGGWKTHHIPLVFQLLFKQTQHAIQGE